MIYFLSPDFLVIVMNKTIHKLLINSFLIALCSISALLANYAMIFRTTAMVISWAAIAISIICIGGILFTAKGWKQREQLMSQAWAGVVLFSLNKWMIPFLLIFLYFIKKLFRNYTFSIPETTANNLSLRKKTVLILPDILLLSISFFIVDLVRNYTVWHEFSLKPLPVIIIGTEILALIFRKKISI